MSSFEAALLALMAAGIGLFYLYARLRQSKSGSPNQGQAQGDDGSTVLMTSVGAADSGCDAGSGGCD